MDVHQHPHEVIDLVSDDEDVGMDLEFDHQIRHHRPVFGEDQINLQPDIDDEEDEDADVQYIMDNPVWRPRDRELSPPEHVIDDSDNIPEELAPIPIVDGHMESQELLTSAACLQMILAVLPDMSVDFALQAIREQSQDQTRTLETCQEIITKLLDDGNYPKEEDEVNRKRKREDSPSEFENDDGEEMVPGYSSDASNLLKDEFLNVPVRHLELTLREHKTFYKTYVVIDQQIHGENAGRHFTRLKSPRMKRDFENHLITKGSKIPKELHAAREKSNKEATKRRKAEEVVKAEEKNRERAMQRGEIVECKCCFDEFPTNRMFNCGGAEAHSFCKDCMGSYISNEIGSSRCRPVCFADPDCGGKFTRKQLQECLQQTTFDRLEHLQQQEDLSIAGLNLDECPFCDFKAECPPVEEDKEFRCLNPKCRKISCRLCLKETHIPKSCKEAKKDEAITVRHIIEEAMSAALIRNCNNCKHPFIKEAGCNKMTCPRCRHVQCYVCSKDVKDYAHFNDHRGEGGCPLHDNVEERHEQEVQKAAKEAMEKAKADNPEVSEAELQVKVSEQVKQAERQRVEQAQAQHQGFPYHMHQGVLRNGPLPQDFFDDLPEAPEWPVHQAFDAMARGMGYIVPQALQQAMGFPQAFQQNQVQPAEPPQPPQPPAVQWPFGNFGQLQQGPEQPRRGPHAHAINVNPYVVNNFVQHQHQHQHLHQHLHGPAPAPAPMPAPMQNPPGAADLQMRLRILEAENRRRMQQQQQRQEQAANEALRRAGWDQEQRLREQHEAHHARHQRAVREMQERHQVALDRGAR